MKPIVEFFRKDSLRKLIALAIALFLFYAFNEKKETGLSGISVRIRNDDPEVFVDPTALSATVRLTVKGEKNRIDSLKIENISGEVRLTNSAEALRTGGAILPLSADNFDLPLGIRITKIEPEVLQLKVQRQVRKDLQVKVKVAGKPGKGKNLLFETRDKSGLHCD